MRVEPFVDTNIWVYAHLDDASDPRCERAWELVNDLVRPVRILQVIAEYYKRRWLRSTAATTFGFKAISKTCWSIACCSR